MCGFQGTQKPYTISGDNGERDPPVPIPNTEVKPFSADGTWLETIWESRTLPDSTKKSLRRCLGLFLCASVTSISPVVFNECATLYLVRIFSAARCAGFRQKKSPGRVGRCRIAQPEIQRTFGGRAPTIHKKSRPFYTADGFWHIRVILKRDTEHARREAGISRPSCAGSRAARSGRRRRPPEASTARAAFCRQFGAARTQTARRNRKSRCRPLHP